MSQNKFRRIAAIFLSVLLLLGTVGTASAAAASNAKADYTKVENVYARLKADGSVNGAYVVNHFQVKTGGQITDYGTYSDVTNLSTTDALTQKNHAVSFSADRGNFYYQGNIDRAELPWNFRITYELDGKAIAPENLGGRDGAVKIEFHGEKKPKADSVFSENYVMQVSLTLDNDTCSNIHAPGATIADAGDSTQLSFTVLPGKDADFTVEADAQNFSMSGFSIAAVPYSISIDTDDFNTDDITDQFSELTDAVAKLNDGAKELLDGVRELNDGSGSLIDGSAEIQDGLLELSDNSYDLIDASAKIYDALDTITTELSQADFSGLSQLQELPDGLEQLADALDQIMDGLTQLKDGFDAAYSAMSGAVQGAAMAVDDPSEEELYALQIACGEDMYALSAFQKLAEAYKQYRTLSAVWSNVAPAFQAVSSTLDAGSEQSVLTGLETVSDALHTMAESMSESLGEMDMEEMFGELTDGLEELTDGYYDFHDGLCTYLDGVDTLADSYGEFHDGLKEYTDGTASLTDGVGEYTDGMGEFADGVSDMPTQVQDTIDEMMEQYNSKDFDAVSFTDERNEAVSSVQFVISTDGVELPEEETPPVVEVKRSFWDRLLALFGLR